MSETNTDQEIIARALEQSTFNQLVDRQLAKSSLICAAYFRRKCKIFLRKAGYSVCVSNAGVDGHSSF